MVGRRLFGSEELCRVNERVEDLLKESVQRVYRFALRLAGNSHQAEDITQETLLRAWRHASQIRDQDSQAVRVWLFQIAANVWRDQLRRAKHPASQVVPLHEQPDGRSKQPDQQLTQRESLQQALRAMRSLPDRQRQVLHLAACEEMSLAEIAEVLGISTGSAKSSLSLARKTMRARLPDLIPGPS